MQNEERSQVRAIAWAVLVPLVALASVGCASGEEAVEPGFGAGGASAGGAGWTVSNGGSAFGGVPAAGGTSAGGAGIGGVIASGGAAGGPASGGAEASGGAPGAGGTSADAAAPCPATPSQNDDCEDDGAVCPYVGEACLCDGGEWECYPTELPDGGTATCPVTEPDDNSPCPLDDFRCAYPGNTCRCDGDEWDC